MTKKQTQAAVSSTLAAIVDPFANIVSAPIATANAIVVPAWAAATDLQVNAREANTGVAGLVVRTLIAWRKGMDVVAYTRTTDDWLGIKGEKGSGKLMPALVEDFTLRYKQTRTAEFGKAAADDARKAAQDGLDVELAARAFTWRSTIGAYRALADYLGRVPSAATAEATYSKLRKLVKAEKKAPEGEAAAGSKDAEKSGPVTTTSVAGSVSPVSMPVLLDEMFKLPGGVDAVLLAVERHMSKNPKLKLASSALHDIRESM